MDSGLRGQHRTRILQPAHRRPGVALLRRLQVSSRTSRREVNGMKTARIGFIAAGARSLGLMVVSPRRRRHKAKHTPEQLKAFEDVFMEQVQDRRSALPRRRGDREEDGRHSSRKTGMACAMCHPFGIGHPPARVPQVPGADRTSSRRSGT